ncbi:unnamed protein product [Trichobilharzia szidati]|nr:unnamed protein product [Trichobilharzia szidati]
MSFALLSLAIIALVCPLTVSSKYDADRLTVEIENLQSTINWYSNGAELYKELLSTLHHDLKTSQDELETSGGEKKTTIAEFVKCLTESFEDSFKPRFNRIISDIIREVHQSYGEFFVIPEDKPLWKQWLKHGFEYVHKSPDLTVCDSLLSNKHTKEIRKLGDLIKMQTRSKEIIKTFAEIKSIYENVKKNMIIGSNISDFQFLYIDFFLITTLGLTFGYTPAYPRLSVEPPGMRLLSTVTLLSLGLQLFTCALVQFAVFTIVRMQPWYLPLNTYHEDYELLNYESTAVFTVSVYQYIILAIVFSKGAPYRRSIFSNYIFLCNVAVCVAASLYLTSHPTHIIRHLFELCRIPSIVFILILHGIALGNLLFGCILESIVDGVSFRQRIRHIRLALFPRHVARKDYERIRDEIDRLAGVWPPIIRSASVQALPRELFNESNVNAEAASQLNYSRKRYNSGLSTDSEDDNDGDNVSIGSHVKAVLYNNVNDTTPTHFLPTSDNPPKSAIENPTRKNRTRSTSSHRRHSFHTGDLDRKEAKRSTSREDAPKQYTPIVSKVSDDEHVRSHSGRRHDTYKHLVDAQPQLNPFHSSTNC